MKPTPEDATCHVFRAYENGWLLGYDGADNVPEVVVIETPFIDINFKPFPILALKEDPDLNDEDEDWIFCCHQYLGPRFSPDPMDQRYVTFGWSIPKPRNPRSGFHQLQINTGEAFWVLKDMPEPAELFEAQFMELFQRVLDKRI